MIRNLAFLNIAEMFERCTYYGVRSILILFLISGLGWQQQDAAEHYGTFTATIYFAALLGGILADLTKKPALIAIIGNSLSTCGIFLLAMASEPVSVYIGLGALAIGSGIFKPAMIGAIWRVSFTHKHRLDLIFAIFYCAINLGAFAAPLVIGGIGNTGNLADYRLAILVAGLLSLIPTVLIAINYRNLIFNDLLYDNQTYRSSEIGITNIVLWFLLSVIFWLAYELFPMFSGAYEESSTQIIVMIAGLVLYVVMIPIHLFPNFRSALKISIGLIFVVLGCLVYPMLHLEPISGLILFAIAEVLIMPVLWSQIVQHVSPRFTATIMAVLMLLTVGINKVAGKLSSMSHQEQGGALYTLGIFCVFLIAGFLLLDHFQKKREREMPGQIF